MSKFLQSLTGAHEPLFSSGLRQLEKTTGGSGIDTRLIADITERSHEAMRRMGLDIKDTTGPELYQALIAVVRSGKQQQILDDTDYVLTVIDGQPISFNVIDVTENSHHEMPFKHQIYRHGQQSLRSEITTRYLNHARTDTATTLEIASSMGILSDVDA